MPESEVSHAERLPLLYQGILIAIVRIQSDSQRLGNAAGFQRQMEVWLDEIEREAIKVEYRNQDVQDAHYVIIAFLDETVRRSTDPDRNQWTSLSSKRYGEAIAGEVVFERLKAIRARRDSKDVADLLEIYALCFALGYQGRYASGSRSELDRLIDDLRAQIDRIRGPQPGLSPEGILPAVSKPVLPASEPLKTWKVLAKTCLAAALVSWIVLRIILFIHTNGAVSDMVPR